MTDPIKQFFRVPSDWMKTSGCYCDYEARVFEVIRIKESPSPHERILVLNSPLHEHGEWLVFEARGHFVAPYTLALVEGLFIPTTADVELGAADIKSNSEFDTFEQAQAKAIVLNIAIREAIAAQVPKTMAYTILPGAFVRRIDADGFPRAKTYRMGAAEEIKGVVRYPLIDPCDSDKIFWVYPDTMLTGDYPDIL